MTKRKQHFVPRFYLKAFQSDEKRIHLFNLKRSLGVKNASLKEQCYRKDFYGPDGKIEEHLAYLESRFAPVLHSTIDKRKLPPLGSTEHENLLLFVAHQILRTAKASKSFKQHYKNIVRHVRSRVPHIENNEVDGFRLDLEEPAFIEASLSSLVSTKEAISDLETLLIKATRRVFITSDSPIVKYNQYCEGVQFRGTTGGSCKGIQIFAPLSPSLVLLLYDTNTYRASMMGSLRRTCRPTKADVDYLNVLQLASADQNLYFSRWDQSRDVMRLLPRVKTYRRSETSEWREFVQVGDPSASMIHLYERPLNLSINLSFLSQRGPALKIPLEERAQIYRN